MKKIFLGLIIIFAIQACSTKVTMNNIYNTKWVLTAWPNYTMPKTDKKALLNFNNENRISGTSFCNVFGGTVIVKDEKIKFDELIGTMMYCEDLAEAESKFNEGLRSISSYEIKDNKLYLLKDSITIMIFTKTK
jgi:heat shock protein HslJ